MAAKAKGKPRKLTPKQERFVAEYLVDLNATRAATAAGYSPKSAEHLGYQLLQNPLVQVAIAVGQQKKAQRVELTQDRVIAEIMKIAFADPQDAFGPGGQLLPVKDMPEHIRRSLSSFKVTKKGGTESRAAEEITEIKFWSKDSALEKLCRHMGLYADETVNLKLKGAAAKPTSAEDLSDAELAAIAAQGKGA